MGIKHVNRDRNSHDRSRAYHHEIETKRNNNADEFVREIYDRRSGMFNNVADVEIRAFRLGIRVPELMPKSNVIINPTMRDDLHRFIILFRTLHQHYYQHPWEKHTQISRKLIEILLLHQKDSMIEAINITVRKMAEVESC